MASLATGDRRWVGALVGAVVMGAVYLLLAVLPGGGWAAVTFSSPASSGGCSAGSGRARRRGLFAGFLVGGLAAVALLVLAGSGCARTIAYGPAMCLGAWVAVGVRRPGS